MHSITLKNISKKYRKNLQNFRSIIEYILGIKSPDDFMVLNDINLEVKKGETLGIIGKNGSGKSTLLKVISGITIANKGFRRVVGRIAPLIEIGAGFQPELTGRENIFFYGAILGIKRSFLKETINEIISFSGIEAMIDTPVKFYSSGMYARLGFAITANSEPDILIVDEVLAVGDNDFQEKCYKKISELKSKGVTIILVSHNMSQIENHCDRVAVMKEGKIIFDGIPDEAISTYLEITKNEKFTYEPITPESQSIKVENLNYNFTHDIIDVSFEYKNPDNIIGVWAINIYTKDGAWVSASRGPDAKLSGTIHTKVDTVVLNNGDLAFDFSFFQKEPFIHHGSTDKIFFEISRGSDVLPGIVSNSIIEWVKK